jgi:hypothetical protein
MSPNCDSLTQKEKPTHLLIETNVHKIAFKTLKPLLCCMRGERYWRCFLLGFGIGVELKGLLFDEDVVVVVDFES